MKEQISRKTFEERIGARIPTITGEINCVVPMKDIIEIAEIHLMPKPYLETLLRNVTLEGDQNCYPYRHAVIEYGRIDPHMLHIGQTFVERSKYQRLIESLSNLFEGFHSNQGFAKCTSLIVIGYTNEKKLVVAHYLTPLIEVHGRHNLIDGVHRNYITRSIGTTIESITLREVACPPPCDFKDWNNVKVVEQKPPREERFKNLNTYYFRNLGWAGIDG